jgi:DNA-binding NarL/FixJ family response regulator
MMPDHRPTVIVVDDNERITNKVKEILASDFDVIATLSDGSNVAQTVMRLKPDLAILDVAMPRVDGVEAAREVRRLGLPVRLVFLSVQEEPELVQALVDMDASYVVKRRMHADLLLALNHALAGRSFISPLAVLSTPICN